MDPEPEPSGKLLFNVFVTLFLERVFFFFFFKSKDKLTSVGVQSEASGAVSCLDPVRQPSIFTLVLISGHYVQNHKAVGKYKQDRQT